MTVGRVPSSGPTPEAERIVELDVARGIAIFGILAVNMMLFVHPIYTGVVGPPGDGALDAVARILITFFAEGKFYTLFSLLFGIGMQLQWARARSRGDDFVRRWVRRMAVLAAFGVLHVLTLWWGDVLVLYALLGFVLLPFRFVSPRRSLAWVLGLLSVPLTLNVLATVLSEMARATPEGADELARSLAASRADWLAGHRNALEVYRGTDVLAMAAQRWSDWGASVLGALANGFLFIVLAMFVLGVWVGRSGILRDVEGRLPRIRGPFRWCLGVGLVGNAGYVLLGEAASTEAGALGWTSLLRLACYVAGAPALSLAYAAGIVLLARRPVWRRRLGPLGAVGRTALTNYLLQSVIVTTLVHPYGGGLYGRIGPAAGLLLTVAIFAVQVPASVLWLRAFRFGPAEWAWRSLTYGRPQSMRRT